MSNNVPGWKGKLLLAAALVLAVACGTNSRPTVSGVAQAGGPVLGTVTLIDSSAAGVRRTAPTGATGAFTLDASGLTAPFLLKVEGTGPSGTTRLFTATEDGRAADLNPITSAAFTGATGRSDEGGDDDAFEHQGGGEHQGTAGRVTRLLSQLRTALAPLLLRYGITDPATDRAAVQLLLADVRFEVHGGVLTVTNRQTGAVIFTGPLTDLASGTFDPGAMPPGPGTTPPPTGDGAALYDASCASCHGALASSTKRGATSGQIRAAIAENEGGMGSLSALTTAQLDAIAAALAGSGGGSGGGGGGGGTGGACTYTYGAWSACLNGTQTRSVLTSTPAGCTGTPVLSQACTTTPPPPDGAALYTQYCAGCHGNSKKGRPASAISAAIASNTGGMGSTALRALTAAQIAAISAAP